MSDAFISADQFLFHLINGTFSNGVFDVLMPFLTDLNKTLYGKIIAGILWVLLVWKGGKKGRIVAAFLVPLIFLSDQISSTLIKELVDRPRPCHTVDGVPVLQNIRLLVDCGSGFSFPSSHAVNNFAAASYFSYYYRRWTWAFVTFATFVAVSRVYVGVHYTSDIIGGGIIGVACAVIIIGIIKILAKRYPLFKVSVSVDVEKPAKIE